MAKSKPTAATAKPTTTAWPRHLARLSMIAAVLCFLSQVAYAQLSAKEKKPEWSGTDRAVAAVGIGLLLSGVVLAGVSLVGAIRSGNYDTGVIAVIGFVINGGVLAFLAWYVIVIRPTLPL
jgi:pantothenate kinase type III